MPGYWLLPMNDPEFLRRQFPIGNLFAAVLLAVLAAGCGAPATPTPAPVRTITPSPSELRPTSAPTSANAATEELLTLTFWVPEFLSPEAPQPAGPLIAEQLEAFSATQDGKVRVRVERKARYGKGGLLDFLRTARPVAPNALPDVVALDVAELEEAVAAGVLQPLTSFLDDKVTDDLYPFAREAGQFDGQLYAVQFLSDLDHAVYLPSQVAEPPGQWSDILERKLTYLFPLASPQSSAGGRPSEDLSRAVLSQYLSAGTPFGTDRRLLLEEQPLLNLLTFYEDGVKAGVIPPGAQELADGEAVWGVFAQGKVPLAYASARRYRVGNGTLNARFASSPGMAGPATPIAGGWALAVVTGDPQRQRAAADLIAWLLTPQNASVWSTASGWLPTSPEALQMLDDSPYRDFLGTELAAARALPAGSDYAAMAARLQTAILSVVKGESDAAAATTAAMGPQP